MATARSAGDDSPLLPVTDAEKAEVKSPSKHRRLASLDIMRGLTMAMMIAADDFSAGGHHWPHLNHSPWNNITFADYVMPWFLFFVGTSQAFSMKKFKKDRESKIVGTQKAFVRALKLYGLGVLLQGGNFPSGYIYGFNLSILRVCGILNRIAFAYLVVALSELWLPEIKVESLQRRPHVDHLVRHGWKWAVAIGTTVLYLILLFGTKVPSYTSYYGYNTTTQQREMLVEPFTIDCNVRGALDTPKCAANGFYDRVRGCPCANVIVSCVG